MNCLHLCRNLLIISCLVSITTSASSDEKPLRIWGGNHGWAGWTSAGSGWETTKRERFGNPHLDTAHVESSETGTGTWRSPVFTISGQMIRFIVGGWSGIGGDSGSAFRLCDAADGSVLRASNPPQKNDFTTIEWYTRDIFGKPVYFEALDNCSDPGYAWLALADVREISLGKPKNPRNYALITSAANSFGIWGILTHDAVNRPTDSYLSSLCDGESGTGSIKSPAFTVNVPSIKMKLRGWDGVRGDAGRNRIELLDESTGELLTTVKMPLSDLPVDVSIDTSAFIGRKVCLKFEDNNMETSFAWMGVDAIDAGPDLRVEFNAASDLKGWRTDLVPASVIEQFGIPFYTNLKQISDGEIKLGIKAERLLLLGMNPPDSRWCWVGDSFGEIQVQYADGKTERYPLILGESLWWGKRFFTYPEPFTNFPNARMAFKDTLRLYPQKPVQNGMYIASINLRKDSIVEKINIISDPKSGNASYVYGISAELADKASADGFTTATSGITPRDLNGFLSAKSLRLVGTDAVSAKQKIDSLRNIMYCTEESFSKEFPVTIPAGYKGPRITFKGDSMADLVTNIFNFNADDMTKKVTSDGIYHTSTKGAAWYGYEGFGCFTMNEAQTTRMYAGVYFYEAWTRDLGRTLNELIALGYLGKAKLCADWCFKMARVWEEGNTPNLLLNGKRLPRHICRILQMPGTGVGEGCFENDGHGLTSLFIYNLWRKLPNQDEWLRPRWRDVKGLGDWVVWQLEHKDLSKATDVLWSDSEGSGWNVTTGYSVYCDLAQVEALRGLTIMAESIGEKSTADKWRKTADALLVGINKEYIENDPKYGETWTKKFAGFGISSTLGPIILPTDRIGFDFGSNYPEWNKYNIAAYQRVKDGFNLNAFGYGQGFIIQSALLLDKMQDADELIRLAARAVYNPTHRPYIVPENVIVNSDKTVFSRAGDIGNGVQQAEILKAIRIMAGIDDNIPPAFRIMPRIPESWRGITVESMPVLIQSGDTLTISKISYDYTLTSTGASLKLTSDKPLPETSVRLGPVTPLRQQPNDDGLESNIQYEIVNPQYHKPDIKINGIESSGWITESGDSTWVWIKLPAGEKTYVVEMKM
ncbi:MAG: hypothetical protein ACYC0V_14630 [Armatimonadota bacterium]